MANDIAMVKSCFFINNASCYEVTKDFIGPSLTVLAAILTIFFAFKQLGRQHRNALNAQKEESKLATRIELFKELTSLGEQTKSQVSAVNNFCMTKKYSDVEMQAPITSEEYVHLCQQFGNALLSMILKAESHEIANRKLFRVFRFALQSIHHDLLQLGYESNGYEALEQMLELTSDAQMYISDFQVCLQNMAYGDVFADEVPYRIPADKRIKVITNEIDNLVRLEHYFENETNWGKQCKKLEQEALDRFSKINRENDNT